MSTLTLRPNAVGNSSQWEPTSGDNYTNVDEVSNDGDTTKVIQSSTSDETDTYNIETSDTLTGATINSVTVYASAKYVAAGSGTGATYPSITQIVRVGSTDYASTSADVTDTSYADTSFQWTVNPADSGTWEKADIDALQIGIKSKRTTGTGSKTYTPYVTQVWAVVDYTAAGTPSNSPSSSPSATPSSSPSEGTPSASPSEGTPSATPSNSPSGSPSEGTPSNTPSGSPSASPSEGTPSQTPSNTPSNTPSGSPSEGTPSGSPSEGTGSASPSEGTPSASPSEGTPSSSPSAGYQNYTRGNYAVLPTNDADLENAYTESDVTDVDTSNNVRVSQGATGEFAVHQFKDFVGGTTNATFECEVQTNCPPSLSTVYLQIYNRVLEEWETIDSDNSSNEDTDFTLSGNVADLSDYKDGNTVVSCRVYQEAV